MWLSINHWSVSWFDYVLYQDHIPWMHQDLKIVVTCSHSKINFFWGKLVVFGMKTVPRWQLYIIVSSIPWLKPRLKSVNEAIAIMRLKCTVSYGSKFSAVYPTTVAHVDMYFMVWSSTCNTYLYSMWYFLYSVLLIKFFIVTHHLKHCPRK